MKFLAFDNTWHVIALTWALLLIRVVVPRVPRLRLLRAGILETVDSLLVAVLLVFLILRPFVVQAFYIPSGSMEDTLQINDRILVSKFIYFFTDPQPGDIVVFVSPPWADPAHGQKDFIKRVRAQAGDRISVHDGQLFINGQPQDEPFIKEPMIYRYPTEGGEYTVKPGDLFVMGDNRNLSNDSTKWRDEQGNPNPALPRKNVLGKAFCIFWPPQRVRILH